VPKLAVFALDKRKKPLMPCSEKRARLLLTGLPVEASSGGRTKYNRARPGIAKTPALDTACVGEARTPVGWQIPSTEIKASGRGITAARSLRHTVSHRLLHAHSRLSDRRYGAGRSAKGKQAGIHVGRVAVRAGGSFRVGNADGIIAKYCKLRDRADGYGYAWRPVACSPG
jgi:hypothetical protein